MRIAFSLMLALKPMPTQCPKGPVDALASQVNAVLSSLQKKETSLKVVKP